MKVLNGADTTVAGVRRWEMRLLICDQWPAFLGIEMNPPATRMPAWRLALLRERYTRKQMVWRMKTEG